MKWPVRQAQILPSGLFFDGHDGQRDEETSDELSQSSIRARGA
jgi:hypothetical protein